MQGLFGRMFGAASTRSAAGVPSYGMIPPMGSVASAAGLPVSQATAMAVSAVYCAVNTIAKDVARCVPSLYQANADGTRSRSRTRSRRTSGIPLDDARLGAGWHAPERGGDGAVWRWTDGDAALALPGSGMLELELAMTAFYWADDEVAHGGRRAAVGMSNCR